jgi:hypothetical protein
MFDPGGDSFYSNDNFAWTVLGGLVGPDSTNRILIGQFTTDGLLELCFNIWVKIPDTLVCPDPNCHDIMEFYATIVPSDTAGGGFAADNKFSHPTLCFSSGAQQLDCLGVPNGTALPGSPCDDNDPNSINDTWTAGCDCTGIPSGIDEVAGAIVTVGPNPVRDMLRIGLSGLNGDRVVVTVRDALGQLLAVQDQGAQQGDPQHSIDLSTLSAGMYFVDVQIGDVHSVHRINKL